MQKTEKSNHLVWQLRTAKLVKALGNQSLPPKEMIALTLKTLDTDDIDLAINAMSAAVDLAGLECVKTKNEAGKAVHLWRVRQPEDLESSQAQAFA